MQVLMLYLFERGGAHEKHHFALVKHVNSVSKGRENIKREGSFHVYDCFSHILIEMQQACYQFSLRNIAIL